MDDFQHMNRREKIKDFVRILEYVVIEAFAEPD